MTYNNNAVQKIRKSEKNFGLQDIGGHFRGRNYGKLMEF